MMDLKLKHLKNLPQEFDEGQAKVARKIVSEHHCITLTR
jgi:hypothetical protein